MFSAILPLLKSKLAALGAVLVIALILVLWGPRVVGYRHRWWCYIAAAVLVIGFLLYLLIKKMRARKNARMLEKFLNQQADDQLLSARPDVQDELAAIKEKLNRALQILKKSRIARGRRGAEALYILPWYMIIGPSASGKSTAIRNSGLHFPPVDPDSEDPGKVKGMGGTRNCDWWFTNEGIILDTAGRYTLSPNVQEDREEWSNFLKMLRKVRPRAPINGLILALSVDELLHHDAEGLEGHARAMRSRIDELIVKLEVLFPIYVVFTKCDLISGFVEFFGDFSRGERDQVWGFTRKYEPARHPLKEEFAREFALLVTALERRRTHQLAADIRPVQKQGTFVFPVEFAAAGQKLTAFIETLFQPNPYQQNPLVRGFYFTSGTQEGTPIAQVMEAMQKDFGLMANSLADGESSRETKAYFIRDFFQEVVLPDEAKVLPTSQAARRRSLMRAVAMAGQALVTAAVIFALGTSYVNNGSHNDSLERMTRRVVQAASSKYAKPNELLDTLEFLRERIDQSESSVPLSRRWGLYSGDIVIRAALEAYFKRYHELLLDPSARELASQLRVPVQQTNDSVVDAYVDKFTAYRMLTMPYSAVPKSVPTLKDAIVALWRPRLSPDSLTQFAQLTDTQIRFYWRHRPDTTIQWLRVKPDEALIAYVQGQLKNVWTVGRLYRQTISEINGELGEFTYLDAATGTARLEGGSIGRAFMRDGWEKHVAPRIKKIWNDIQADPQLKIAFASFTEEEIRRQLTEMYVSDFVAQWRRFITSGTVVPFRGLEDAKAALDELSQKNTPMLTVLIKVYEQSEITDPDDKPFQKIDEQFRPLGRFLGYHLDAGDKASKETYLELFSTIPDKVNGIKDKLAGEARCAQALRSFFGDLDSPESKTRRLLQGSDLARVAVDFLVKPLQAAKGAAYGDACNCLDHQWQAQVLGQFNTQLATLYPFTRSSESEAPVASVESFFNNTMKNFIDQEVDPAIQLGLPVSGAFQAGINAAKSIQPILARGASKLRFSLTASAEGMTGVRNMEFRYSSDQVFNYGMGGSQTRDYKWPQAGNGDCELRVFANQVGAYCQPLSFQGEWGVFRLFDAATERTGGRMAWDFPASDGRTLRARLALSGGDAAFILDGHFTRFQCPPSVCH